MMRKSILIILLNTFSAILQTSFLLQLFGNRINPNLIGALCFSLLLSGNIQPAYWTALMGGLFLDLLSGGMIGITPFLLVIFVWIYNSLKNFYLHGWFAGFLFSSVFFYLYRMVSAGTLIFDGWLILGSFLTAAIGYFFSFTAKKIYEKTPY